VLGRMHGTAALRNVRCRSEAAPVRRIRGHCCSRCDDACSKFSKAGRQAVAADLVSAAPLLVMIPALIAALASMVVAIVAAVIVVAVGQQSTTRNDRAWCGSNVGWPRPAKCMSPGASPPHPRRDARTGVPASQPTTGGKWPPFAMNYERPASRPFMM
jgi:hypothetical protein